MWWWHADGGGWWLGALAMIAFWGLVAWAVVTLVRSPGDGSDIGRGGPEAVLAERFARGEIDEDEYRSRLAVLRGEGAKARR